jgi:hypothetical protein
VKWQDFVLSGGSLIFSVALVPAIRHSEKAPLSTSAMTAAVLFVFAAVFSTLQLWFSSATAALNAAMWAT